MAIHGQLLHNGEVVEASSARLYAGQLGLLAGWGVFTTLRVKQGCPFAWERHWARMTKDARLLNVEMPLSADGVYADLLRLIDANGKPDCTLRLTVVRNGGGLWEDRSLKHRASDVIALTADSKNWGETVSLSVQPNARYAANEFAGAKIISWACNLRWLERAQSAGCDETILLNEHDRVAECTSANIFAVFGKNVVTPALSEGCLAGITREVLLTELSGTGIAIREGQLTVEDLHGADEVFITSTTRDLRGVREIGGTALQSAGGVRRTLSAAFAEFLDADIARRAAARAELPLSA